MCIKLLRRRLKLVQLWYVMVFNMRSFNSRSLRWTFEELQVFNSLVQTSQSERRESFRLVKTKYLTRPLYVRGHSTKLNTQCSHQLFICFLKIACRYREFSSLWCLFIYFVKKKGKKRVGVRSCQRCKSLSHTAEIPHLIYFAQEEMNHVSCFSEKSQQKIFVSCICQKINRATNRVSWRNPPAARSEPDIWVTEKL